jgi:carboxypeptidase Taq
VKLPKSLVEELTRTAVLGQQAWVAARRKSDFASFRPWLEKIFHLKRQEADALGFPECRYDALLDGHEPEMRTAQAASILRGLRDALVPLLEKILASGRQADIAVLQRNYPTASQEAFGREAAARIGFDFDRGRLDVTIHPFCAGLGPHDCRITTRYNAHYFNAAFFGIAHEAGHGIYEQGLRGDQYGLPPGSAASLGLHESQSRLWENFVARSRPFWQFFYPRALKQFPEAMEGVSLDAFYFAVNDVRPSLIRVEADEATYNLHILIRFELEQAVLQDDLAVADLPGAWNEKYEKYLSVRPPNDAVGVLQDIHWSAGLIGYFPTYAFGNLYAAQMFAQAERDLGGLAEMFARGEFRPLRNWLCEKVHRQGRKYPAAELIEKITGKPLSHAPLVEHLRRKLGPLYGFDG